jgi:diguanylate cyclase
MGAVTASFGIAQLMDQDCAETFIDRADRCLYAAKNAGRNRIETDDPTGEQTAPSDDAVSDAHTA